MIRIEINPGRVERVIIDGRSEVERDFDLVAYRTIKSLVERIDRRLRRAVDDTLKQKASAR
jgi:hypothetical protein